MQVFVAAIPQIVDRWPLSVRWRVAGPTVRVVVGGAQERGRPKVTGRAHVRGGATTSAVAAGGALGHNWVHDRRGRGGEGVRGGRRL